MAYAGEYTPEITTNYLANLQKPIEERGIQNVGRARGEALRRGLTGDPFESLRVGTAINNTSNELTNANNNLAYNVAGLQREERMIGEKNAFESAEAEKQRKFQEQMAVMQNNYANNLLASQRQWAKQDNAANFWPNLLGNTVSLAGGVAAGKYLGR